MKRNFLVPALIMVFLVAATTAVVLFGRGYRLAFNQDIPKLSKTGLLVANSVPNGAQVYVDDHLTTATDNTISLPPGTYTIKMLKDGYFPWEKKLKVEEEVVTKAQARLFPLAPRLESIATTPVENPLVDPSGTKIAYQISSESAARKNGIYVLNMNTNTIPVPVLTLKSSSTQIADNTIDIFSSANLQWSPDGTELLAEVVTELGSTTVYLLDATRLNEEPQDVTAIIQSVKDDWQLQIEEKNRNRMNSVSKEVRSLINNYFDVVFWSPDETKILYKASASAELPVIIKPRRLGNNTLVEQRKIETGNVYIYDTKEDVNVQLAIDLPEDCSVPAENLTEKAITDLTTGQDNLISKDDKCKLPLVWLTDSEHLIYRNNKKITLMDDDGSNRITVYGGPFIDDFSIPWPDSSKIVILTDLNNPDVAPTLYTIGLK